LPTPLLKYLDDQRTFYDAKEDKIEVDRLCFDLIKSKIIKCPMQQPGQLCWAHPIHHNGQCRPIIKSNYPIAGLIDRQNPSHQTYESFISIQRPTGLEALNSITRRLYDVLISLPPSSLLIEFFHPLTLLVMKLYIDRKLNAFKT
jgi:hypothetical protein